MSQSLRIFNFNFDDIPEKQTLEGGSPTTLSNFDMRLRIQLKKSVEGARRRKDDPISRTDIASRMTKLLGREFTKSNLDQCVALSTTDRRLHVDALKALCEVTNDYKPLEVIVESCGFKMLTAQEATTAEYGSLMLMKEMIDDDLKNKKLRIDIQQLKGDWNSRLSGGAIRPFLAGEDND